MPRVFAFALLASLVVGCGGRGLPRFARDQVRDNVLDGAVRDAGQTTPPRDGGGVIIVRDGGPTVRRDGGPNVSVCGDGLCDRDRGEDYVACPGDCPIDPFRCVPGIEGCACNSSYVFGDRLQQDDCRQNLLCAPWDVLSGREPEVTRPVQSCVRPCGTDADCGPGRVCTSAFDATLGDIGAPRICVDRVAQDDFYCGGERDRRPAIPGVEVRTGGELVGCRSGATCVMNQFQDVQPSEGVCLQLCGPGRPACSGALPYCNPVLADGVGVCSAGRFGPGSWCSVEQGGERAGYTTLCDQGTNAQVFCVGLGVEEGLCMEICNAQSPCTVQSATNPYYCEEGLLQNGDGICLSSNCSNFPDTCGEAGPLGTGRMCLDLIEDGGLCVDRRTPILAPTGLDTTQMITRMGDDCQAGELTFAQCPDGTFCLPGGAGDGFCIAGCNPNQMGFCEGLLQNLGLPADNAQCIDAFMQPNEPAGICAGD